ncbi:MAG: GxxExxY protein [Candidatus Margulisbacteria bacterium]|nr:GxxExxY protein [Candidatus Margulisiibacteriota bacterium]
MGKIVQPELSYKIMGVLFAVHNELGPNCNEKHYQRAIRDHFEKANIKFNEQLKVNIKRPHYIATYYIDFLVESSVILEIKATPRFSRNHILQLLSYLRETGVELGILANFSRRNLIYKRILRGFSS